MYNKKKIIVSTDLMCTILHASMCVILPVPRNMTA